MTSSSMEQCTLILFNVKFYITAGQGRSGKSKICGFGTIWKKIVCNFFACACVCFCMQLCEKNTTQPFAMHKNRSSLQPNSDVKRIYFIEGIKENFIISLFGIDSTISSRIIFEMCIVKNIRFPNHKYGFKFYHFLKTILSLFQVLKSY